MLDLLTWLLVGTEAKKDELRPLPPFLVHLTVAQDLQAMSQLQPAAPNKHMNIYATNVAVLYSYFKVAIWIYL